MSSVRLQSLAIQGFKSFATRTLLEFAPGVTAIVGPNGSGKTNVADAIRWVLGSQSPRALRIAGAEDVVFAGGNGRAPVGLADVQLTLNNEDTWLPVAFREVVVGRRAFRSGESEYVLNKSRVRLRDLLELLAHGGLGPDGHALVAQGLADQALSLNPAQRRDLFEDASGVRQYRLQRTEAEHKIAEARRNAARVADLVHELKPRVATLRRQARRAEQETRLREQWQSTLGEWVTHELWEVGHLLTDLTTSAAEARLARAAGDDAVAQAGKSVEASRRTAMELRSAGQAAPHSDSVREAQQGVIRHEREVAAAEARQEAAQRETVARRQAAAAASDRAAGAEQALPHLRNAVAAALEQAEKQEARLATLAAQTIATEEAEREATLALESTKASEVEARQRLAQAEEGIRGVARRRAGIVKDQSDVQAELERIADEWTVQSDCSRTTQQKGDEAEAALRTCRGRLDEAIGQHRMAQDSAARGDRELQEAERTLAASRTRLSVLTTVAAERSPAPALSKGIAESAPMLVERLRVPASLDAAVAATLGAALRWRLVEDLATAGQLAADLATHGGPRTTFVPRNGLVQRRYALADRPSLAGGRWLDELIQCDPEDAPVLAGILGRTCLVQNLARALELVQQVPLETGIRFVTERGELVEPLGAVTAGGAASSEVAVLSRERQVRECRIEVARWEREHQKHLALVEERQAQLAAKAHSERTHRLGLRQAQRQLDQAEEQVQEAQQAVERLQRDQQWWEGLVDRAERSHAECTSDEAEYRAAEQEAGQALVAARAQTAALVATDSRARLALRQSRSTEAAVRTEAAVARQAARTATEQLQAAARRAEQAARVAAEEHERAAQAGYAAREQTVDQLRSGLAAARTKLADAEQALREHQRAAGAAERDLQEGSDRLSAARAHATTLASRLDAAETRLAALKERQAALHEQAERDLGAVPTALTPARSAPAQLRERAEELRRRLHNLGPINQMAVEEHATLAARLAHLTTQMADIEATAMRLEQLRNEVDQRLAHEFRRNIDVVGEHFRDYCARLLGGEGRLIVEDDSADGGIELDLHLPGRRRQPLAALSGGERALASAALLFALLRARPTLFCVLDEVDAALDETNVVRFCEALEELAQETQFLVITHNRVTMERADALYGVSSADDGVSQVISLRSIRREGPHAAVAAAAG
ncbi:MAG: chromosome segregation protein SMC [Dehalococcoidia bacterium]|nr:chromosome segregation protein SMC [Dehalococcoidia bacterium]